MQISQPDLPNHIHRFLFDQSHPDALFPTQDKEILLSTYFDEKISVFHSAVTTYYAPSDHSGIYGMLKQRIQLSPIWQHGSPHHDCIFIVKDPELDGMHGSHVVQVILFLSFTSHCIPYPCTLIQWFVTIGDVPCGDTRMWIVRPEMEDDGSTQVKSIIHVNSILRGAHLIGIYGGVFLPNDFSYIDSLAAFQAYYVNKFINYHANEIAY